MTTSLKEPFKSTRPINPSIEEASVSGDFWQGQPEIPAPIALTEITANAVPLDAWHLSD
jgi:hypothetical protein